MGLREFFALAPIAAACLWIGVRPQPLIDSVTTEVESLAAIYADQFPDKTQVVSELEPRPRLAHAAPTEER
jgi:NADH:ubiquinone oxidoreductase subunit 4 (subunit M)